MTDPLQSVFSNYRNWTNLLGNYNTTMDIYNRDPKACYCFVHTPFTNYNLIDPTYNTTPQTFTTWQILQVLRGVPGGYIWNLAFVQKNLAALEVYCTVYGGGKDLITEMLSSTPIIYQNQYQSDQSYSQYQQSGIQTCKCFTFQFSLVNTTFLLNLIRGVLASVPNSQNGTFNYTQTQVLALNRLYRTS